VLEIVSGKGQLVPEKQTEALSFFGYLWKRVVGTEVKWWLLSVLLSMGLR
jgi:hypothetical protein